VEAALAGRETCALVLLDLDNFKDINDRHGHIVGDKVLQTFADRIRSEAVANNGIAARLGGDEFAIFLKTDNLRFLRLFCDALLELCNQPIRIGNVTIRGGFSGGLATSTQLSISQEVGMEDLMRVADFALYASKAAGRGCYTLYDSDLEAQFNVRRELLRAMPKAIETGEIEVFFQPKVDLVTGLTVSFEALARWRRDGRLLQPAEFITIAEETGMIIGLDEHMLDAAVETIASWNARHGTEYSVSVNLSALHFRSSGSLAFVKETLDRHGLPPRLLTLEITESVQLANWSEVGRAVASLRALGCRIAIDDFGAGFSSLAYLRMISADELKIDRALVREIASSDQAQFILDAVLELAEHLGLDVVVEGVEDREQHLRLREMGCRVGQGYFFCRPIPAEEALTRATAELTDDSSASAS
ncbi:MAG: bifunctional diguanylate cyclase/phosphodiesterase, partial [Planctomycetota bacterium]